MPCLCSWWLLVWGICVAPVFGRHHQVLGPTGFLETSPHASSHSPAAANLAQLELHDGGMQPQIEGDIAVWDENNKLDSRLEFLICVVWVGSLTSLPAMIRYLSGQPFTWCQLVLACLMWAAIFGGLYLFTNVILFQSAHFTGIRPLYIVECIYLMSQVITTVGYGDITPAKARGQVFVGMYVLISFLVIAMCVSDMVALIMKTVQEKAEEATGQEHTEVDYNLKVKAKANKEAKRKKKQFNVAPPKPTLDALMYSSCVYAFFAVTWVLFFHLYPGEGKTWFQALYMSIITLSTVGFGAFTPNTAGGMVFASFWMIFGSAALVSVVGAFSTYVVLSQDYERFDKNASLKAVQEYREKNKSQEHNMTEIQFIKFTLIQQGVCTEEDVDDVLEKFQLLAEDGKSNKFVNLDSLQGLV